MSFISCVSIAAAHNLVATTPSRRRVYTLCNVILYFLLLIHTHTYYESCFKIYEPAKNSKHTSYVCDTPLLICSIQPFLFSHVRMFKALYIIRSIGNRNKLLLLFCAVRARFYCSIVFFNNSMCVCVCEKHENNF